MNGFYSAPTPDKRREKHLVFLLTILGILLFVISGLPGTQLAEFAAADADDQRGQIQPLAGRLERY